MFGQVCTIEPSLFKSNVGEDRYLFEGRHLVLKSKFLSNIAKD